MSGFSSANKLDKKQSPSKSKKSSKKSPKDYSSPADTDYQTFGKSDRNTQNSAKELPNNSIKDNIDSLQYDTEHIEPNNEAESPILFLDVNFGNGNITRIVMYENDTPEELAEAFCLEHKLDDEKRIKLVGIIKQHLDSVLDQITEQPFEE